MKLIKINSEHYIIVDDLEIKIGDWVLDVYDNSIKLISNTVILPLDKDYWKKITHSTQPLEYTQIYADIKSGWYFDKVKELDLSYIKSLVGEVDVTEKANIQFDKDTEMIPYPSPFWFESQDAQFHSYIKGYNQCLEEHTKVIHKILDHLCGKMERITQDMIDKGDFQLARYRTFKYVFDYIKSLTEPKTEWEVEFINGQLKLK